MSNELLAISDRLLVAILNSVYQGVLITLVVWLALLLTAKSTNASTRHGVWFVTLLMLVLIIPVHCLHQYAASGASHGPPVSTPVASAPTSEDELEVDLSQNLPASNPILAAAAPRTTSLEIASRFPLDGSRSAMPSTREHSLMPLNGSKATGAPYSAEMKEESALEPKSTAAAPSGALDLVASGAPLPPLAQAIVERVSALQADANDENSRQGLNWADFESRLRNFVSAAVTPISWNLSLGSGIPRITSTLLLALCLAIALMRILLLVKRLFQIRRMKRESIAPNPELLQLFEMLRARAGVTRKVELRLSPSNHSPLVLGFFHPVVLLPAIEVGDGTEQILGHELAHVSRRDDWFNLAQHVLHSSFFFHPSVWWISKRLSIEREIACDDHVLQLGGTRRSYALLLANLAGRIRGCPPLLAPGVSTHKSQLQQRIDMILNTNRNTSPGLATIRLGIVTSAAAFLAAAAVCAAPRFVLAQNDPPAPAEMPEPPVAPAALPTPPTARVLVAPNGVATGPKIKSEGGVALGNGITLIAPIPPQAPVAATVPTITATPLPNVASVATTVGTVSEPETPRPPKRRHDQSDSSIEDRLARLEKLVESLVERQHSLPGQAPFRLKSPDYLIDKKQIEQIQEFARRQAEDAKRQMEVLQREGMLNADQMEKMKRDVERETAKAREQLKQAAKEMERALKDQKSETRGKLREGNKDQLKDLRKQLEELQKEREKLDRQIERLEQNLDQSEDQQDEDQAENSDPPSDSKPECPEEPAAK